MNDNLAVNLVAAAEHHGDRPALRLHDATLTYAALGDTAARVAGFLHQRGVSAGDRVAVMLPNVLQFAAVYYGTLHAGAAVVPMNVLLKAREVAFHLRDSQATVMFVWHEVAHEAQGEAARLGVDCVVVQPGELEGLSAMTDAAPDVAHRDGSDTAVILYTSGTTGTPKGAELTHSNLRRNADVMVRLLNLEPRDVLLGALPLFHAFGQTCGLNAAVASGSCLTLLTRFDAQRAFDIVERDRVTVFEGVPTMFSALLNHPERSRFNVSSLRTCVSGGAALPVEVLRGFEDAFGCVILEGYGLSETSPVACFNDPSRLRKPGSIGTPVEGVEMRVVDEAGNEVEQGEVGEIVIRGHNVMKGYWQRADATAAAITLGGWFHSGDLARIDEDGYFFIVDRKKDLIIRGGYNVYPREIEEVLYEHDAVRECAVVGIRHPVLGEEVGAAVVLRPGYTVAEAALRSFVEARVAAYKYPRVVWFLDELPKGPTGKIQKRDIVVPEATEEMALIRDVCA